MRAYSLTRSGVAQGGTSIPAPKVKVPFLSYVGASGTRFLSCVILPALAMLFLPCPSIAVYTPLLTNVLKIHSGIQQRYKEIECLCETLELTS